MKARSGASRAAKTRASAARPKLQRRNGLAQPALAGAALIPHAAVRSAGAIRDLSDSGLIVRLTRGRGWIAVLCALLGGIVTLNVLSLSLNAGSGRLGQQISEYERANSGLRAEIAEELSASRVAELAPGRGYYVPAPEAVGHLTAGDDDLQKLLRLFSNDLVMSGGGSSEIDYGQPASTYVPAETVSSAPATSAPATPLPSPAAPEPAPAPAAAPSPQPSSSSGSTGGVIGPGL